MAAFSMLLVSTIMLVSTTYAWFTLSTAPEVSNIQTTVAGNGSLEIALMPTDGDMSNISSGSSGTNGGGTTAVTTANTSWGNLITLSDTSSDYYGLSQVTLLPATLSTITSGTEAAQTTDYNLFIAQYGSDGRIGNLVATKLKTWSASTNGFGTAAYGVRAYGEEDADTKEFNTYGYVVDLAFRLNAESTDDSGNAVSGKLQLQTSAEQRIYSEGSNEATQGGGSYMSFTATNADYADITSLLSAIRITFVQDYGVAGGSPVVLGTARLDTTEITKTAETSGSGDTATTTTTLNAPLYLYKTTTTQTQGENGATEETTTLTKDTIGTLTTLEKNKSTQVSAIVWLDGNEVTNADMATQLSRALKGTLNLQFSTNVNLTPAANTELKTGNKAATTTNTSNSSTTTTETSSTGTQNAEQ
jgi:hypothetical protein